MLPAALLLRTFSHAFLCSFSIGMVAACHPWGEKVARWLSSPLAAVAGVVLLAVLMLKVPASYSPVESLMLAPVFFMIVSGNSFFGVLTCRPMRCLGQISYSVYIFHGFLLFGLTRLLDRLHPIRTISPIAYWTFIWLIALLVVAVSTFTYWFIERPFMTRRTPAAQAVAA